MQYRPRLLLPPWWWLGRRPHPPQAPPTSPWILFPSVMGGTAKKWRDFKFELKTLYFDETITGEELQLVPDNRVSPTDSKELVAFWRTDEGKEHYKKKICVLCCTSALIYSLLDQHLQECSQQGQQNREQMELLDTTGIKSHARVILKRYI